MNVLFSDASRSPPPGPVSERRARRPPRRTHIGTSQSTHNGTAVAKALAAEAHNPATGAHSLDFKGRVTVPSVKNFQLVIEGRQQDDVICQFGKVGDDEFHLDFKAPLNPLQAFALAVAHFNF